jgi:hypothetical protein
MSDVNENRPLGASRRAASGRCLRTYPEASMAARVIRGRKDAGMLAYLSSCSCRLPDHRRFTVTFLSCMHTMLRANAQPGNGISSGGHQVPYRIDVSYFAVGPPANCMPHSPGV